LIAIEGSVAEVAILLCRTIGVTLATTDIAAAGTTPLCAEVPFGAGIAVITRGCVVGIRASAAGHAGIICANIIVITVELPKTCLTAALATGVVQGTGIAIITGERVGGIHTAIDGIAAVRGAKLSVVTAQGVGAGHADFVRTDIAHGTCVAIVTVGGIRCKKTSVVRITTVGGAAIAVITIEPTLPFTGSVSTDIIRGARVAIITWQFVPCVLTTCLRLTAVRGAEITIVAILDASLTKGIRTGIAYRAEITIVTGEIRGLILTTAVFITAVFRANISIITLGRNTDTPPVETSVFHGAFVPILAGEFIGLKSAFSGGQIAVFRGAGIAVIAGFLIATDAKAPFTYIIEGAGVSVLARQVDIRVQTTVYLIAAIIRTGIVIGAIEG